MDGEGGLIKLTFQLPAECIIDDVYESKTSLSILWQVPSHFSSLISHYKASEFEVPRATNWKDSIKG